MTIVNLRMQMHADAEHPLSAFSWLATANTENPLTRGLKPQTRNYGNTAKGTVASCMRVDNSLSSCTQRDEFGVLR